jgi:ribose/xylose/arabinose/galactoside ABC-type transport system permease subunit
MITSLIGLAVGALLGFINAALIAVGKKGGE